MHLNAVMTLDWTGILEQTCYIVVEQHREGVAAINIAAHETPGALKMRLDPILQENQTTLFYGEGDSLKSFLSTYIAVLVQTGMHGCGMTPMIGNVLYLDYETDVDTFWERVNMVTAGLNIAIPDNLFYRSMIEPLVDEFPRVNSLVMEHNINLVIVDSAAPATGEPEKAEIVTAFFRALRSLQSTSLVIAHMTKTAKGDYPFGSTFWRNLPRSNFQIKADRTSNNVAISLRHTKANNGKRLPLLGFEFRFDEDCVEVSSSKPIDHPDLAQDVPLGQQLRRILSRGEMSLDELENLVDKPRATITTTLNRNDRIFLKRETGNWGLIEPQE